MLYADDTGNSIKVEVCQISSNYIIVSYHVCDFVNTGLIDHKCFLTNSKYLTCKQIRINCDFKIQG